MKHTVFADSFYFFALINPDDVAHDRALAVGELDIHVVTTDWVLIEVADGLAAGRNRRMFADLLRSLRTDQKFRVVPFGRKDFEAAISLYVDRDDKRWSLTDCSSFVVMQRLRLTDALTADRHFEQAGFAAILV